MFGKIVISCLLVLISASTMAQKEFIQESKTESDKRMKWWRDARFGMFVHWGLYAVPAGGYKGDQSYGEWIMTEANIPIPEYEKFAGQFNPVRFDADKWVKTAADAGVKYIVITSKHHDGFSMFDSQVSDYDIVDHTPFKRDPMKELSEACKKFGLKFCFYHSIMDWHHPEAKGEKFSLYRENYLKKQLKELLTNYGEIGVLWFDGEWIDEWTEDQGKDLYNYVRSLQPNIIINNRVGKGRNGMQGMNGYENAAGDFGTPEQEILNTNSQLDWESCMTMNDHWGYNRYDKNFKPSASLIWNLVDCAAKGGNYLLNIGPTAEGLLPVESIERMKDIGNWMKINSRAIYGSKTWTYFEDNADVRYTTDINGNIYALVKGWPGEQLLLKKIKPLKGSKVKLLGTNDLLNWTMTSEGIIIDIPVKYKEEKNRPCNAVYVFQFKGKAQDVCQAPIIGMNGEQSKKNRIFDSSTSVIITNNEPGTTIHYTLDGSDPTLKSPAYTNPVEINQNCIIKAISSCNGKISSNISSFELMKTKYEISLLSEESPKHKFSGPNTLVDGKNGSTKYDDGNWLCFEGNDFEAVIDLVDRKPINEVRVSFLQSHNSWIFFPLSVEVYISDDNINFVPAGIAFGSIPTAYESDSIIAYNITNSSTGRYIKIKAKNVGLCPSWHKGKKGKAWLMVDEIEVN